MAIINKEKKWEDLLVRALTVKQAQLQESKKGVDEKASERDNNSTDDVRNAEQFDEEATKDEIAERIIENHFAETKQEAEIAASGIKQTIQVFADRSNGSSDSSKQTQTTRTIALGITNRFVRTGKIDWRGRKLSTNNRKAIKQLATYAMVLRNPSFETFRVFYTKGDETIANDAFTSYLAKDIVTALWNDM